MTATLTVLYTVPDDPAAFDEHYLKVHVPIVLRFPGIETAELSHIDATIGETQYHLMARMTFADRAALDGALGSEAGAEAGADFGAIAPPGSFMVIGHTLSENG